MATGIKDKVAILGMGCSRFGERWDAGSHELMRRGVRRGAGRCRHRARARSRPAWFGRLHGQRQRRQFRRSRPRTALRLDGIPFSRMENMCATGTEALRGAAYAVASGAVDIAARDRRREAEGHRLRRPAAAVQGHVQRPVAADGLGARRLCAARRRLSRQARRVEGGPEARHRPRVVEEPPERRAQPQGAPAQGRVRWRRS